MKIGLGYDIHELVKGRKLILGGVSIPFAKGLKGHSDADVLLHAISDAILGALGAGDIGEHFPNTDKKYKDISSMTLLREVNQKALKKGFLVGNVDCVVIAEKPNLKAYKPKMKIKIAEALSIPQDAVNIKATTREGLGYMRGKEAIEAYSTVLLTEGK